MDRPEFALLPMPSLRQAPATARRAPATVLLLALALHGATAWLVSREWSAPMPPAEPVVMQVALLEAPMPTPPVQAEPPKPSPRPKPKVMPKPRPQPAPEPLPKAEAPVAQIPEPLPEAPPTAESITAPPQPPAAPVVAEPEPVQEVAPRFDAAYLNNPAPGYPAMSRRLGEQGKVFLRVLVSVQGGARQVEIKRSSGSPRLDAAASEAVRRWKFVPARRGDVPVEAWVVVPVSFRLES